MSDQDQENKKSYTKDGIYILIILTLLGGGVYLGYLLSDRNKKISECSKSRAELESELAEVNDLFSQSEVNLVSDDLKSNLENMLSEYEDIEVANSEMQDSLNRQKEKIKKLKYKVEQNKGNARMIYKLRKEAATLREIMKGYIHTIDSLNQENKNLKTNLAETNKELGDVKTEKDKYKEISDKLETKVSEGARLVATGFNNVGLKIRSSGKQIEVDRANRTDMIRSCFTIGKNPIAQKGDKYIYLRVVAPNGNVLYSSSTNTIQMVNGMSLIYSDRKQINYNGESIDVCIYYDLDDKSAPKGNYTIEAYTDGVRIGSNKFVLN